VGFTSETQSTEPCFYQSSRAPGRPAGSPLAGAVRSSLETRKSYGARNVDFPEFIAR
jgi:hypothetical protein